MRRHLRRVEDSEFMLAQLTACVVNFSMTHPEKPLEARDLMPSQWAKRQAKQLAKPKPKPKRRSRAVIAQELRGVMDHFMRHQ